VDHEGRWLGIFQPDREESTYLEKMTKGETAKNVGLRRSILKLWELKIKSQLFGPPKRGRSAGDFLGGNLKRGK